MSAFAESGVESSALAWLSDLGWQVRHGSEIAPCGLFAERQDYGAKCALTQAHAQAGLDKG